MSTVILSSVGGQGWDFKFAETPKGNEMEPSKEQYSINIAESKQTAFSSIEVWPSLDLQSSLPPFSNKLILFLNGYNFLCVLLLKLAVTRHQAEAASQTWSGFVWVKSYYHLPPKSQTSNGFGFSNIPLMLFKQRYMQAAGDSASKIGLNKNNHIVLEQKIVFNW